MDDIDQVTESGRPADGNAPAWNLTPVDGDVVYAEGTAIGYRGHYAGEAPAPAPAF